MNNKTEQKSWWNRPLPNPNDVLDFIFSKNNKAEIPEDAMILHKNYMAEFKTIGTIAKTLDSDKFNGADFLFFLKIRGFLVKNSGDYIGLKESADLLEVAIKAKNSFLAIDQAELQYRGLTQQRFYERVITLLNRNLEREEFRKEVKQELETILPDVKSEEGQRALENYQKHLDILSENDLGLKLLSLFKKYNLTDYSILNRVAEIMDSLAKEVLTDSKVLIDLVEKNFDVFEKLAPIIGINKSRVNDKTFVRILQYLALQDRHRDSYKQFESLIITLKDWEKAYSCVKLLRDQYSPEEYQIPDEFKQDFPALDTYRKYQVYLES
jgi:hypothetical protein